MKKRILAFVMALVLVFSMVPTVSFAATSDTKYLKLMANTNKELLLESVKGAPVYTKNVPATFTDESGAEFSGWAQELTTVTDETTDEWNLKFFYDDSVSRWTAVLKGAKLDAYNDETKQTVKNAYCLVGQGSESYSYDFRLEIHQDSYLEGKCMLMANGSNRWTSVNIISENGATLYGKATSYGIYVQRSVFITANLDCSGSGSSFIYTNNSDTSRNIAFYGGTVKLDNFYQFSSAKTYPLKLNGGTITLTNATAFAKYSSLVVKEGLCYRFTDLDGNTVDVADLPVNGGVRFESYPQHILEGDSSDCTVASQCTICGVQTEARSEHEAGLDDGDCTTAVTCKYCSVVMTEGKAAHESGDDDGNCATAVKCINCDKNAVEAKEHIPGEDDGDCLTPVKCANCEQYAIQGEAQHTPGKEPVSHDPASCTEDGKYIYKCEKCEETFEVTDPSNGHDYKVVDALAPTANSRGYNTYKCEGCGDTYTEELFMLPTVAMIGKVRYTSLQDAVDAAQSGDIIKLMSDKKDMPTVVIPAGKKLTIDFNGKYYAVSQVSQGAALVIEAGAEVQLIDTVGGGKLEAMYASYSQFNTIVNNTGNLVVENVILNGNNLFKTGAATMVNSGTLRLKKGTVVNINRSTKNSLINSGEFFCESNSVLPAPEGSHWNAEGKLEAHFHIPTQMPATVYEVAYTLYKCDCGHSYKIPFGDKKLPVSAKIGDKLFASVQEAVDVAENGDTIVLTRNLKNVSTLIIPANKKITIDLNSKYYAVSIVKQGAALVIEEGAELNLISTGANAKVEAMYASYKDFTYAVINNGKLTLENVTINGNNLLKTCDGVIMNNGEVILNRASRIAKMKVKNDFVGEGTVVDNGSANAAFASKEQMENVAVTKTATAGGTITLHPGRNVTYSIHITNNNAEAISVKVADSLPDGVVLIENSSLNWTLDNIASGETRTVTYTAKNTYTIDQVRAATEDIVITNTDVKVMDKAIPAANKNIWVLETFNATDRYRMETAIDALTTANLTQYDGYDVQMNGIGLASQMYWVGFSASAAISTPDLNEILTLIYEKGGESEGSGSAGSGGEADAVEATNLLKRVVPTLYGGTMIPASKDAQFRGQRAMRVSIEDLISGDLIIVSNNDEAKLYIVDGKELVELGKTYVTRSVDPATVLPDLPGSDKYVVLRCSIGLASSFSLEEGEVYNNYDKQELTEIQNALVETAKAYLLRGDRVQYDDGFMGKTGRFESLVKNPEDYTVDQYGYLDCAHFTYDVNWATFGVAVEARNYEGNKVDLTTCKNMMDSAKRGYDPETYTGTNKSTIFYYEVSGAETDAEKQAIKEEFISRLQPGDQIVYRYPEEDGGHAMMYIGNGLIIHCAANRYNTDSKRDSHDASIRFMSVEDLFNQELNARRYIFDKTRFGIIRLYNEVTDPTVTENTANRVANLKGIIGEKVASTAMGKTVNPGDTITYTFYINNTNQAPKVIEIRDELSEYVTFVSATNGGVCEGKTISWDIEVAADTRISVSYTVKVNEGVATYTAIDGSKATINGVVHKCIDTYVAPTMTQAQQQAFVNAVYAVKDMDISGMAGVDIINLIYKTAFGVDNIFGEGVTTDDELVGNFYEGGKNNVGVFNNTTYWSDIAYVSLMDANTSNPAMMVAPGMFGGNYVYNSSKSGETFTRYLNVGDKVLRSRYFWEKDMVVGDVFFMRGKTTMYLYVYVGNDTLVSVGAGTKFAEVGAESRLHYTPATGSWRYYAVLRPSMVVDLENADTPDTPVVPDTPVAPTVDGNINASVGTTVNAGDVSAYKTSTHLPSATVTPGKQVAYSIVVTNNSTETKNITITEEIPAIADFQAGCDNVSGNVMTWNLTLDPEQSETIVYTLKAKNDEANLGQALTSKAKVNGTAVPFHDIFVERTLGKIDQGLMETAIDAFRQYTDLKGMNLLKMIWNVAISKSVSYNDATGKTMNAADLLKLVFTGEGSTGDSEGSGEEAATAAVDFTKAVIPTIFGGTGATAQQMAQFNGLQANKVAVAELMSGDAIFVQETENDNSGKIYIFNGKRLFLVADGVKEVDTYKVLNDLPQAYRYAGFRFSFVIANRKDFSEDRKDTFTEEQKVVIAMAEAYLLRGDRYQYDAGSTMKPNERAENAVNTPEDITSDNWQYTNCSILTYDVFYFGLNHSAGNSDYTGTLANSAKNQKLYYYEPTGTETDAEKQAQIDKFYSTLQPADIIVIRRANDSGHAMLYIGDGKVIHSTGGSYKTADTSGLGYGIEQYEATVRYLNAYDYFDPKCDNGGAYSYYVFGGAVTKIGIYRPLKNFSGSIPEESVNRMNNLQGIAVEKVASKAYGQTVNVGEYVTYTFKFLNANDEEKTLNITDVIPAGTSLISAEGATVDGNNLAWTITIEGGEKAEISYIVKVGTDVPNGKLESKSAKVGGVSVRSSDLFIANTLDDVQQQAIINAVASLSGTSLRNLELVNEIYKIALGVENVFEHTTVSTFHSQMYEKKEGDSRQSFIGNQYSEMVAPGLYGGRNFMCEDDGQYGRITRLPREHNLIVGDIIFGRTSSSNGFYMYLGNGICWNLNSNTADTSDVNARMERAFGYKNYWAILRPSMSFED